MTRFRKAVDDWKKRRPANLIYLQERVARDGAAYAVILLDVVKVVDSYERTIKALKKQNRKLREGRR